MPPNVLAQVPPSTTPQKNTGVLPVNKFLVPNTSRLNGPGKMLNLKNKKE